MNRRESILSAVAVTLTGLATTGANVSLFRAHKIPALPALTIEQGSDVVQRDISDFNFLTRELEVTITLTAGGLGNLSTVLNQIAAEVFSALMADITLGLAYVIQVQLSDDSAVQISGENEQTTAQLETTYTITYRHSGTTTEA